MHHRHHRIAHAHGALDDPPHLRLAASRQRLRRSPPSSRRSGEPPAARAHATAIVGAATGAMLGLLLPSTGIALAAALGIAAGLLICFGDH